MIAATLDGRPVTMKKTRHGWAVKWGRTIIGHYRDWRDAVTEIILLYRQHA